MNLLNSINEFYYETTLKELQGMNNHPLYPNISYNSLLYLDIIAYKEKCTVSELSQILNISKAAVTIKINELLRQGFVVKTQSDTDKRVNFICVSKEFYEDFSIYNNKLKKAIAVIQQNYDQKDIEQFCEILKTLSIFYTEEENDDKTKNYDR